MPKRTDYTLRKEELEQVQSAMKSLKAKVAKRASVVHSLHLAYSPEEVAELHYISLGNSLQSLQSFQRRRD
jgi:DNA-directed RNA polymerase specialized sigma24 family protein